ncbi:MAG: hypothetical protein ACE5GE_10550 [Phycisphaerae bacterium]
MKSTKPLDFGKLTPPADHGDVLVEPAAAALRAMLDDNRRLVSTWKARVVDQDLAEVRRRVRQRVAGVESDDVPVVVTGHQPEFIHAGVWAKHVVAVRLAEAADGRALNLVVDTDVPKQSGLSVPHLDAGRLTVSRVNLAESAAGQPYECLPVVDRAGLDRFEWTLREALGRRFDDSMMPVFCEGLRSAGSAEDYVDQSVAARQQVETCFGVRMLERRVSRCWLCPLFAEMLRQPERFADCYNQSLAQYRGALGIHGRQRPIPDLIGERGRIELPVWVTGGDIKRHRLFVESDDGRLRLYADRRPIGALDKTALESWESAGQALSALEGVEFRPRALTLTLWARLFLADLFIHGIGGAKYDRITDTLIERYFGIAPPGMGCVSATLRLHLPRQDASVEDQHRLEHQLRDLRYNPQRHLEPVGQVAALMRARDRAVARSISLRAGGSARRTQRREVFEEIRSIGERMLQASPGALADLSDRLERTRRGIQENRIASRRDFFFALHSRSALKDLCGALPEREAFVV